MRTMKNCESMNRRSKLPVCQRFPSSGMSHKVMFDGNLTLNSSPIPVSEDIETKKYDQFLQSCIVPEEDTAAMEALVAQGFPVLKHGVGRRLNFVPAPADVEERLLEMKKDEVMERFLD